VRRSIEGEGEVEVEVEVEVEDVRGCAAQDEVEFTGRG